MSKAPYGEHFQILSKLFSSNTGCSLPEACKAIDRLANTTGVLLATWCKQGKIHKSGVYRKFRYFLSKEHADAYQIQAELAKTKVRAKPAKPPKPVKPPKAKKSTGPKLKLDPRPSGLVISTREQDQDRKREAKKATVTWPENVKVQVIPTGQDTRYKFIPPEGWKGQITQDWYNRRLAA